ncbi:carboxypeptidase-like regulatory domain-containing protein [Gammaproteobacteria bacterium]|nr:carboxypeptidase-like regulatory domain-containing protein [Gammaproteobacteria bacterium]
MINIKMYLRVLLFSLSLTVLIPGHLLLAQGSISGSLIDPNGANITGLNQDVTLVNVSSGEAFSARTNLEGNYSISDLPAGTYDLSFLFRTAMYQSYSEEGVVINDGEALQHDLNIEWSINLGTIGDDPGMLAIDMLRGSGDLSGPTPRLFNGSVDFSGMWVNTQNPDFARQQPPFQAWAAEMNEELRAMNFQNPGAYCLPQSAVIPTDGFPWQIVQTPDIMIQIMEFVTPGWRQVFLDGREMPELWNPSWQGHSRGHWEGDTLVVVSSGFNDYTPGFGIHTDNMIVTERYTRPELGRMLIEVTVEDPEALTDNYTNVYEHGLVLNEEILEFVCAEGNTDPAHWEQPIWQGRP